jgi:peptidyl-tRNA hydrolase ICT1
LKKKNRKHDEIGTKQKKQGLGLYGMATTSTRMVKGILLLHLSSTPPSSLFRLTRDLSRPLLLSSLQLHRSHPATAIRCASSSSSDSGNKKVSSRLSQVQQLLNEAEHRSLSADINAPIPKITLGPFLFLFSFILLIYAAKQF